MEALLFLPQDNPFHTHPNWRIEKLCISFYSFQTKCLIVLTCDENGQVVLKW